MRYEITDADVAALDDVRDAQVDAACAEILAVVMRAAAGKPAQMFALLLATLQGFISDTNEPIGLTKCALAELTDLLGEQERMAARIERAIARGKDNPS